MAEIETIKIPQNRKISIPDSFSKLQEGDEAIIETYEDVIIIKPIKKYSNSLNTRKEAMMLAESSFAKDWLSEEDDIAYAHLQKYKKK